MYEIHNLQKEQLDYIKKQFKNIQYIIYQPAVKNPKLSNLIPDGGLAEDTLSIYTSNGRKIFVSQAHDRDFAHIKAQNKYTTCKADTLHNIIKNSVK